MRFALSPLRPSRLVCALLIFPLGLAAQAPWVSSWGAAPSAVPAEEGAFSSPTTLREIVHLSRGGTSLRITLSNELGTDALAIGGAHVALRATGAALTPGSDHPLTFHGEPSVTIPPGAAMVSDPVVLNVAASSDLAISLLLPGQAVHTVTTHPLALQTSYRSAGDHVADITLEGATPVNVWQFLKSVEVSRTGDTAGNSGTIVTLGDSITDGYKSTPDTNRRWPDVLAQRLGADKHLGGLTVVNEGISGNRLLHNGAGPNALARLDRDVLSQSGVKFLILLEGINDIGGSAKPRTPDQAITVDQVIAAYAQIIERAHAHGIKVYGATLTPFMGAGYSSPAGETMRQTANAWIRAAGHFDGVIDFDRATRDPSHPDTLSPTADSGDHLHPSDAGYKSMGESIDLKLFRP